MEKLVVWILALFVLSIVAAAVASEAARPRREFIRACDEVKTKYECIKEWRSL